MTFSSPDIDIEYPQTLGGSHEAVGLAKTWLSAAARYGPYGYREDEPDYNRKPVEWDSVDWGQLQNQCMRSNAKRFSRTSEFQTSSRLALRTWKQRVLGWDLAGPPRHRSSDRAGRTAIVIRSWDTYDYTGEDLWNLRSIIAEAALATGGEYAVYLLVDVKDKSQEVHRDPAAYAAMLEYFVPEELRGIAVLFDETLLESWYPGVVEHRCVTQFEDYGRSSLLIGLKCKSCNHYSCSPTSTTISITIGSSRWTPDSQDT